MAEEVRADLLLGRDTLSPGLIKAGRAAADASGNVRQLTRDIYEAGKIRATPVVDLKDGAAKAKLDDVRARLAELSRRAAAASIDVNDKAAVAKLAAMRLRLDGLSRKVSSPRVTLEGTDRAEVAALALDAELDRLGKRSVTLGETAGAAESGISGMGAALGVAGAAAAALAPIVVTLGIGTAGFGAAAAGTIAPILKASESAQGLAGSWNKLNAEQQQAALSVLAVKQDFAGFQKALAPTVLTDFGKAAAFAGRLLGDIRPVSLAVGKALGGLLDRVDAEFASQNWQQFFGFIAKNAGPDMQLLGNVLIDVLRILPQLLEELQPLGTTLLRITDVTLQAADAFGIFSNRLTGSTDVVLNNAHTIAGWERGIAGAAAAFGFTGLAGKLLDSAGALGKVNPPAHQLGVNLGKMAAPGIAAATIVATLTGDLNKMSQGLLANQADQVSWRNAVAQATATLKANSGDLSINTQKGRDDRTAILGATNAALTFAQQQLKTGGSVSGASRTIQAQIDWLRQHAGRSRFAADQIAALRHEEDLLNRERLRAQTLQFRGAGRFTTTLPGGKSVTGNFASGTPGAAPGWAWVGELGPELVQMRGGETVLPAHVSKQVAPLPGYAGGTIAGLGAWIPRARDQSAEAMADYIAATMWRKFRDAANTLGAGGFGGGPTGASSAGARAAQAFARSVLSYYGWGQSQMSYLIPLWNQESGWNRMAYNASSGATGIPQALPYSKMPRVAWLPFQGGNADAGAQIDWGLGYIRGRYGSPAGAWAHERAFNWYDSGYGTLPPGLSLSYNGTGRPEPLMPARSGGGVPVVLEIRGGSGEFEQFMVKFIRGFVRVKGGGDVQKAFGRI